MARHRYLLDEDALPTAWYNINADLPAPLAPPLHPGTHEPVTPDFMSLLLTDQQVEQEMSAERWIEIPEPVREVYRLWRPTPLIRAVRWEKKLDTPAHIYFKYEGVSPVGSHKPNTAVAQAFYNREAGTRSLVTETGAGQWGSAMAMACAFFDLDLEVFMVRISHDQKPYRRSVIENYGATIYASPTDRTAAGRAVLAEDPDSPGSLGLAISEAMETVATSEGRKRYCLGSCLGHVLMHQTVVGLEALEQMEMAGEYPDIVVACAGGGSNFGGFAFPFVHRNLTEGARTRVIAAEPTSCPTLTRGRYAYDFGDQAGLAPLVKMHTLGHGFIPPVIHAGGLRYHGMAPQVSALVENGDVEGRAVSQVATFESAVSFARAQGIIPAPESSLAIRVAMDEALHCRETGESKVIAFNLSGHGHFDMMAYDAYHAGEISDDPYPEQHVDRAMADLPTIGAD